MTEENEVTEVKPTTGAERAAARQEAKALALKAYYADTTFTGDKRAAERRLKKAMEKHAQQMNLRARRRYA